MTNSPTLIFDRDPNQIYVVSMFNEENPSIHLSWGDKESLVSVTKARYQAQELMSLAAIAEVDHAIVNTLKQSAAVKVLRLARDKRDISRTSKLGPINAQAIVGSKTNKPLVRLSWGFNEMFMEPPECRQWSAFVTQAAEASESDVLLAKFMRTMNVEEEHLAFIFHELSLERQRQFLEASLRY